MMPEVDLYESWYAILNEERQRKSYTRDIRREVKVRRKEDICIPGKDIISCSDGAQNGRQGRKKKPILKMWAVTKEKKCYYENSLKVWRMWKAK